ncbi:MAG: FAD-dependent oxidoreductase [Prolixibacteraceae bacterium]|jgi:glycine/D-amino acid oxidase-like deaminating enzyme|nr:FAD-dependent oxidoreductase [Prolixibacteraceae bacterium]
MASVPYLIVGQGLAGTLLAFELYFQKRDFRIVASSGKNSASGVAAGLFNPLVFKRLTKSWMIDDLLPVMEEVYPELEKLLGRNFCFKKDILKLLSGPEMEKWEKERENRNEYILEILELPPVGGIAGAAGYGRITGSGFLDLGLFLDSARNFFSERGWFIETTVDYSDFDVRGNSLYYKQVEAEIIVFCEGAYMVKNPFFPFLKMRPAKGELLLIEAPGLPGDFIITGDVFVLPLGGHLFKTGSTYEWNDLSDLPTAEGYRSVTRRLEKLITVPYTVKDHWAGIRPTMSDRRPVIGFHPEYKNTAVFNGLGTKGVMLAPYFAREMACLLADEQFCVNREVRIGRFLK